MELRGINIAALGRLVDRLEDKIDLAAALPPGGETGQVLTKCSGLDRDTAWTDLSAVSPYELAVSYGFAGDEISFNLALASLGQDLTRVPVTITVTHPDGTPFANMPVSIFASGGAAQSTVLNENGQFTRGFIPERDYTIRVIRQPGDEFFNTSVNFSTGTLDLPTEISFRVVHGSLYADPTELDEIWRVAALTDASQTDRSVSTFGSSSGATKWIGGVLAPNGKIYGIPSHTTTVLEIDPDTRTTSTFGSLPSGSYKWYGGVLAPNGKVYGIPLNSTTVLEIDPDTRTVSTFGSLSGSSKWYGGVLAPNGKICGIPGASTTVLEIDPDTQTTSTFGSVTEAISGSKWIGGVLAPNGKIYGIPNNSTTVLEIDPDTRTTSTFGSLPSGTSKWWTGALGTNGKIYGIPCDSTTVLEIDPDTRTTSTFGSISGTAKYRSGAYGQNGKIYGIPCSATTVLEIDPDTQTTSTFGSFSSGQKWYGGVLAPNGKIYGIPTETATVLEIGLGSDPDENLSGNALLSGWINKL